MTRKKELSLPEGTRTTIDEVLDRSVALCVVFGSAVRGRLTPQSDIDIGIAAERPLDAADLIEIADKLSSALHREVDLIDLRNTHGLILSEALTGGVFVRRLDKELLTRLMLEVIYFNEDFRPLIDEMHRKRVERFIHG